MAQTTVAINKWKWIPIYKKVDDCVIEGNTLVKHEGEKAVHLKLIDILSQEVPMSKKIGYLWLLFGVEFLLLFLGAILTVLLVISESFSFLELSFFMITMILPILFFIKQRNFSTIIFGALLGFCAFFAWMLVSGHFANFGFYAFFMIIALKTIYLVETILLVEDRSIVLFGIESFDGFLIKFNTKEEK